MNWKFSAKGHYNVEKEGFVKGMGYVYIAKIYVMNRFFLTKNRRNYNAGRENDEFS